MTEIDDVLRFWFPEGLDRDAETHRRQIEWWFRGGADAAIVEHWVPVLESAIRGELDAWAATPRGRLALIIVLDQFSRSAFRDSPRAYAQDDEAARLCREGLDQGMHLSLPVWEQLFFGIPLSHSESLADHERNLEHTKHLAAIAPPELRAMYEFSNSQARGHHDVIERFGRHPHRNAVLGRESTPEELEFLASTTPVHQRKIPGGES